MGLAGKKKWIAIALLALAGVAAWVIGWRCWGSYHERAAHQALERRDFQQAGQHLQKCLELWPNDGALRLLAAQTARRGGDLDEADRQLRQCPPDDADPSGALALEHRLWRLQRGRIDQGDFDDSDALLEQCANRPSAPETPLILEAYVNGSLLSLAEAFARSLTNTGGPAASHLTKTLQATEQWLQLRPGVVDQAQGLAWRGQLRVFANDHDHAVADFTKALELDAENYEARTQLAQLVSQRDLPAAAAHLQVLRRRFPADNQIRFPLARILRGLGQWDQARQLLDEILAGNPDEAVKMTALLEHGKLALDAQLPQDAERWLRQALQLRPDDPDINLAMGRCLQLLGRAAEAQPYLDRFQQIDAQRKRQHGPA